MFWDDPIYWWLCFDNLWLKTNNTESYQIHPLVRWITNENNSSIMYIVVCVLIPEFIQ